MRAGDGWSDGDRTERCSILELYSKGCLNTMDPEEGTSDLYPYGGVLVSQVASRSPVQSATPATLPLSPWRPYLSYSFLQHGEIYSFYSPAGIRLLARCRMRQPTPRTRASRHRPLCVYSIPRSRTNKFQGARRNLNRGLRDHHATSTLKPRDAEPARELPSWFRVSKRVYPCELEVFSWYSVNRYETRGRVPSKQT